MTKLLHLIKWEFVIQNKINNLSKFIAISLIFTALSMVLINRQENIDQFGILFVVIYTPLALIGFVNIIVKQDFEDGSLELLLLSFTPYSIILAKAIVLFISALIGIIISCPIIMLIFHLPFGNLYQLLLVLTLILLSTCPFIVLIATMQNYFYTNTYFLSILIVPLILPNVIMAGLVLDNLDNFHLVYIMLGINLVIIPLALLLSSYLIKNIYNVY